MQEEDQIIELSLEKIEEKDSDFYFTAKTLTQDFECPNVLKTISKLNINQPYIWRHRHPIDPKHIKNHIYGKVVDSWFEEDLYTKYKVYDHTQDHKDLIELIKKKQKTGDPLGISLRYRKYRDKEGNITHVDVLEHSGTYMPKCEECKINNFEEIINEEEKNMDGKKLEDTLKRIEELETKLDSKTDDYQNALSKIETLEDNLKTKDKTLEKTKDEKKTLEDRIMELEDSVDYLNKKPYIDEILEVSPLKKSKSFVDNLKSLEIKDLKEIRDIELERSVKNISVKSQEESASEVEDEIDEKSNKKDPKVTLEEFTKNLPKKVKK